MFGQQSPPAEPAPAEKKEPVVPPKHKVGPLEISVNWRTRAEGWNWFEGKTENSDYGLWDSLLRVGIGQTGGVISAIYPKDANGQLIFLETNFHF